MSKNKKVNKAAKNIEMPLSVEAANTKIDPRLQRIADRAQEAISPDSWRAVLDHDKILNKYITDREAAKNNRQYLRVQILTNMIEARRSELRTQAVLEILPLAIANGEIIKFLDEDDRAKLLHMRFLMSLVYDMIDSVLNDYSGFFNEIGITGDLKLHNDVLRAREVIDGWQGENTCFKGTNFEEVILEEMDRLMSHLQERSVVLLRKIERISNRMEREEAKHE